MAIKKKHMKKLDCLILSTGRAASTAIYRYIDTACELNLPVNKEPHFWCNLDLYDGVYPLLREINKTKDSDYWQLYRNSEKVIDASVGYFFCLDDVIEKLHKYNQNPKVIFLYRDPVSRARSLFNELKKKKIVTSENFLEDIKIDKKEGLWWEFYYDNVFYFDNFEKIRENFSSVIAINYDYFCKNQTTVILSLSKFLGVSHTQIELIDFTPVNSSYEALFISKFRFSRFFGKFFPTSFKQNFIRKVGQYLLKVQKRNVIDLSCYLNVSLNQFKRFREQINYKDMICIKK
jgi:hypothetical protein